MVECRFQFINKFSVLSLHYGETGGKYLKINFKLNIKSNIRLMQVPEFIYNNHLTK